MKRSVLISGSTRGIGLATAAEFLRHGDRVTVLCRHRKHVDQAVRDLSSVAEKGDVFGVVGDVRTPSDVAAMTDQCLKRFGKLDILVNNAGVAVYKPIAATTDDDLNRIIDTNLKGTFLLLRQAASVMGRQKQGIIINISSGLGVEGMAGFSAYCASKFGVVGLTKAMADELGGTGIRIYAVLPGAVDTGLVADSGLRIDHSELLRPEYLGRRIVEVAEGGYEPGTLIDVYS
ncbi:MAG: SDR family oxidoreductase [Deltaproteobacteria bacterium]|nr:SDR family oxidoreductase [Deltaproteobacteria bacterium]